MVLANSAWAASCRARATFRRSSANLAFSNCNESREDCNARQGQQEDDGGSSNGFEPTVLTDVLPIQFVFGLMVQWGGNVEDRRPKL